MQPAYVHGGGAISCDLESISHAFAVRRDRAEIQTAVHRHPGGKLELCAVGPSCERARSAGNQPETTRAVLTARSAILQNNVSELGHSAESVSPKAVWFRLTTM